MKGPLERGWELALIVRRSLRQHALSTLVTVLSTALASGLVMAVFSLSSQTYAAFAGGKLGFDAVLGGRGSQLQIVLNAVFHLETSPGNVPWELYEALSADPRVELAIPYVVGDNYRGQRIVGTTEAIFTRHENQRGHAFEVVPGGRFFDPERREAVIGAMVARETGLAVGSTFAPYHGVHFDEDEGHEEEYVVVGVLEPTSSPSDRVIWIPIEGLFRMGGHFLQGAGQSYQARPREPIPAQHKEVSAVMLAFTSSQAGYIFQQEVNRQDTRATLAWPIGTVMAELFGKLGWMVRVLQLVAYLVVAVAAGSILASIYNSMNERRRDFAVLRALGARRRTVFALIVSESTTIAALGSLSGYVVYFIILGGAAAIVREQTGVVIELWASHPSLWITPLGMLACGALAGLLPAFKAYGTDVATNLARAY